MPDGTGVVQAADLAASGYPRRYPQDWSARSARDCRVLGISTRSAGLWAGHGLAVHDRIGPGLGCVQPGWGLLAIANADANTVSVFSVGAGGALTQVTGSPFTTGSEPVSVAFSPDGTLLMGNTAHTRVQVYLGCEGVRSPLRIAGRPLLCAEAPYEVVSKIVAARSTR